MGSQGNVALGKGSARADLQGGQGKCGFIPNWCLGGEDQLLMASECERGDSPSHRGGRGVDGVCAPAPPRLSPQPQGSQLPLALMGRGQQGHWASQPPRPGWEDADSDSSSHRQLCFCFQSSECGHPSPGHQSLSPEWTRPPLLGNRAPPSWWVFAAPSLALWVKHLEM